MSQNSDTGKIATRQLTDGDVDLFRTIDRSEEVTEIFATQDGQSMADDRTHQAHDSQVGKTMINLLDNESNSYNCCPYVAQQAESW